VLLSQLLWVLQEQQAHLVLLVLLVLLVALVVTRHLVRS
jgi:hypothetical protein